MVTLDLAELGETIGGWIVLLFVFYLGYKLVSKNKGKKENKDTKNV